MPVPDEFIIAPDFTICEYCGKSYADTNENIHRVLIGNNGEERVFVACIHCIEKAKIDKDYENYMTEKTFKEKLGRLLKK